MVSRAFWIERVERAWASRSVIWLSGVRRVGKTFLCQSLADVEYFDCELPRTRRRLEDPESFLAAVRGRRIALDEVHRLPDPTELLKIAADHFPDVRVLATGSSALQASARFRDKLTGRKVEFRLLPLLVRELEAFGIPSLEHRLLRGGLPPFFLSERLPEGEYQEWVDSYWARDIQELYRLERRQAFQRLLELIFVDSGGIFEASRFAASCEVSRGTISNYLAVLEETSAVTIVRPYSSRRSTEIVSAARVYGFDTGFVCFFRGWTALRPDDLGPLWEHLVLNEMQSQVRRQDIRYWRDKRGHEIDFVLCGRGQAPTTIECKWSVAKYDPRNLRIFRTWYPEGQNWLVAQDVRDEWVERYGPVELHIMGLPQLAARLQNLSR